MVGVDAVVRIAHAQGEPVDAGHVQIDGLMGRAAGHDAAVENLRSIGQNMEHDRTIGPHFVVHANIRLEARGHAAQTIFDAGKGMNAKALGVIRAVEGDGIAADAAIVGHRAPTHINVSKLESSQVIRARDGQYRRRAGDFQDDGRPGRHVGGETVGKTAEVGSRP